MNRLWKRSPLAGIMALAVALRLLAWPLSNNPGGDPVSRIWGGWHWWEHPRWITSGVWGPLHFYLLGTVVGITGDTIRAPVLMNILFSVATLLPLYYFVRREFSRRLALFAAACFALYPVAFQNSLTSMSETPFVFFVAVSLLLVSYARDRSGQWWHALLGGLTMTLACMLRYEGWVLIPFMAAVLIRKPIALLLFAVMASLHPVLWMLGNQHHHGDMLYSVNAALDWQTHVEGINVGLNYKRMLARGLFVPCILFLGMTPPISMLVAIGVVTAFVRRRWTLLVWLVPFGGLALAAIYKVVTGGMFRRPSYSIILGFLILPYAAVGAEWLCARIRRPVVGLTVVCLCLASMLPLSYVDYQSLPLLGSKINVVVPRRRTIKAIPRDSWNYVEVCRVLKKHDIIGPGKGLICDFVSWHETKHIALHSRMPPEQIELAPGGRNQQPDPHEVARFVDKYKKGGLVLKKGSRFSQLFDASDPNMLTLRGLGVRLTTGVIHHMSNPDLTIYAYSLMETEPEQVPDPPARGSGGGVRDGPQ